jgi:hypothetical protein
MNTKFLAVIAIVLFVTIIFLYYILINSKVIFPTRTAFKTELMSSKPKLLDIYVKNPDMIYSKHDWLFNLNSEWNGTGYAESLSFGGRDGVISIHPVDLHQGRHVEQEVYLPQGKYRIFFGVADIADMFPPDWVERGFGGFNGPCADVGIRVKIVDISSNKEYVIFDKVIKNGGWYDYSVDLGSLFSNKRIKVRVESYAADNGCGIWNGEWAAVDYIDIQPY